jgi:hypothetical protein
MAVAFVVGGIVIGLQFIALLALSRPGVVDGIELVAGIALCLWAILRLSRCGITADADGVRVLNPLTTTQLRWDEIARFELADQGPALIERRHGRPVKIFGLQQRPVRIRRSRRTREAAMIDELNARLHSRV